jgi:hypothetical protein
MDVSFYGKKNRIKHVNCRANRVKESKRFGAGIVLSQLPLREKFLREHLYFPGFFLGNMTNSHLF